MIDLVLLTLVGWYYSIDKTTCIIWTDSWLEGGDDKIIQVLFSICRG